MNRVAAVSVVLGLAAVAAPACLFTLWLRRRRAKSLIQGLFEDYFAERFAAEELGRRVRASLGRRFTGGNEFFAEGRRSLPARRERSVACDAHCSG